MNIAGEHNVGGTQSPRRRIDPLAHTGSVDRDSGRILEYPYACKLGSVRKPERIVERMNVKCGRVMDAVKIVVGVQRLAHTLDRPAFDHGAEILPEQADLRQVLVGGLRFARLAAAPL